MTQLSIFDQSSARHTPVQWLVYIDGASRHNPGPAGAGIYIVKDKEPYVRKSFYLGTKTNNQAEYYALLLALFFLEPLMHEDDELHIFSDSQLLVRQMSGQYKVKDISLRSLFERARAFVKNKNCSLHHVMREYNKIADRLANKGINDKEEPPAAFFTFCTNY